MTEYAAERLSARTVRDLSRATGKQILMYRWLGAWIDFAVFWGILVLAELGLGSQLYQRTVWLWVLVAIAYFPVCETLFGKTLGKKVTGLIVVNGNGARPSAVQVVKRTLLRIVEVNPLGGGLIAALAVLISKDHQRLGDLWAGSFVVRVDALEQLLGVERGEKQRIEEAPAGS